MKNKALIDWKLTIDYTALSTTIETLAFSIEKQRAQIEDLQLHCRNNPLQNKLQDLSNTTDSRFIDLVKSVDHVKQKLISLEEKEANDINILKATAIKKVDEQNNTNLRSIEKLGSSLSVLQKEFTDTTTKLLNSIEAHEKETTLKIKALQDNPNNQMPTNLSMPAFENEQDEASIRKQILYLHSVINAEKEARIEAIKSIEKNEQQMKLEKLINDALDRVKKVEEDHFSDLQSVSNALEEKLQIKLNLEKSPKLMPKTNTHLTKAQTFNLSIIKEIIPASNIPNPPKTKNIADLKKKIEEAMAESEVNKLEPLRDINRTQSLINRGNTDRIELIEHSLRIEIAALASKIDNQQIDSLQKSINIIRTDVNKIMAGLKVGDEFKKSTEQALIAVNNELAESRESMQAFDKKIRKLDDGLSKVDLKQKEFDVQIMQKADILEFKLLKNVMEKSNQTIDRLCSILENVNFDDAPSNESSTKSQNLSNLRVLFFKLHDRMVKLESNVLNKQASVDEELKDKKSSPHDHDLNEVRLIKIEAEIGDIKSEFDILKLNSMKQSESSILDLKKNIDSLGTHMHTLYKDLVNQLQEKMKLAINHDMLEEFKATLMKNVQEMNKNLEKVEMNNQSYYLRKKIEALENKISHKYAKKEVTDQIPMMMCNSKCFFCSHLVDLSPEKILTVNRKMNKRYSFKSFNPTSSTLYGPGFSRVLEAIRVHPELEDELFSHQHNKSQSPIMLLPETTTPKTMKTARIDKGHKLYPITTRNSKP